MVVSTEKPQRTVDQVRDILDELAATRGGKKAVADLLKKHGNGGHYPEPLPEGATARAGDLEPKRYDRVFDAAEKAVATADMEAAEEANAREALADYEAKGKQISSVVDKINREEDEAIKAYNDHAGESTALREHLADLLAEAEPICKAAGMRLKDLKAKYIGDRLGNTQFKQILRVARGQITFQEIKDDEAAKKRDQRANKKDGTSGLSRPSGGAGREPHEIIPPGGRATPKITAPDGSTIKIADLGPNAQAMIRAAGNSQPDGGDGSERIRKLGEPAPVTVTVTTEPAPAELTAPVTVTVTTEPRADWFYDLSAKAAAVRACHELIERGVAPYDVFVIICDTVLPRMNQLTRAEARKYVTSATNKCDAAERRNAA